ncbi:MAG: SMI1/KNR4 family protein [Treponema sp.]|nr:SMI1/KNR4 family protein [Treponema sp.]MBO6218669.1 SMI1/KNR4 family protein [Treponema sp.]
MKYLLSDTSIQELIEQKKFPIAENCLGDTFCIDSTDGSIWLIYHDESRNKKIADDFESFIQGCKSKKLGHIRTIEERRQLLLEKRGKEPTEAQLKGWQEEIDIYSKMKQEEVII